MTDRVLRRQPVGTRTAMVDDDGIVWVDEGGKTCVRYVPAVVTDEMIERACAAAFVPPISDDRREDMRAALRAALEAPDA